ncbi:hypothetical protein, partial [Arhodomonas sp. AD133]|uniref:hypothetical protein n=1 Tax=Arhodomonas sp. AD133 TaxID=3415009 RepID=UPI003EBE7975
MKQFLRYQISGTTFMFWVAIFGIGGRTEGFSDLAKLLYSEAENFRILAGVVVALPIGVLIHQLSVLIKNWVVGRCCKSFSDFPQRTELSDNSEIKKYCLSKISSLNSFSWMRDAIPGSAHKLMIGGYNFRRYP